MTDARRQVAAAVRDYIARQHMSREEFAFRTKLGKSTVDKLMIGLFSPRTLSIVEAHTELTLRPLLDPSVSPRVEPAAAPAPAKASSPPSIAVLPFANLSGDPAQDFFAEGITDDIATALARLRWLLVIASGSTNIRRDRTVDVREVGRALGVRYVLEGSVRVAGGRLRITGQLVEAETGKHIWAERFDRELSDIFAVQDDIAARVVAAVEPHLYIEEGSRAARAETIDAWSLVVRAIGLFHRLDRSRNEEACALLRRAISLEPSYARAHALLGWATWWAGHCDWLPDRRDAHAEAALHANEALRHDPDDPWARMVAGLCHSTARQHARALAELAAALAINPSFALGHTIHGWALLRAGQFEAATAATAKALRLSPLDSFSGLYTSVHGLALIAARRFDEALPYLRSSVAAFPSYGGHYNSLICCCGHLGLLDEAREFLEVRSRMTPPLQLSAIRKNLAGFAHLDVFLDGLVHAGVPE
jgi:TolB-like protein/Flp pilus assembly protein TadD